MCTDLTQGAHLWLDNAQLFDSDALRTYCSLKMKAPPLRMAPTNTQESPHDRPPHLSQAVVLARGVGVITRCREDRAPIFGSLDFQDLGIF